jgi:hypothetical protein
VCGLFESGQKEFIRDDVLALDGDVQELKKIVKRIERDYTYVFHGFTFFDVSRLMARNCSFEKFFAELEEVLRLLDRHVGAVDR